MNCWTLRVRVTPRASRDEIEGWDGEVLRVRVTAPPAKGEANDVCVNLLAKALGVARSRIVLVRGGHSREKVFQVEGGDPQVLKQWFRR